MRALTQACTHAMPATYACYLCATYACYLCLLPMPVMSLNPIIENENIKNENIKKETLKFQNKLKKKH